MKIMHPKVILAKRARGVLHVACAWMLSASTATAQDVAIEACRQEGTDADRIACLEAALAAAAGSASDSSDDGSAATRRNEAPAEDMARPEEAGIATRQFPHSPVEAGNQADPSDEAEIATGASP